MGKTPEERRGYIEAYTTELMRTMVSSRGLFDGNALFAMTNNSGGASQNWDMRMATVVAPILGDIMKHSKLGNANYMAVRSYAGGTITSKAVQGLMDAGLVDDDIKSGKVYQDKQGWHLAPNSKFAEGINENMFDWSRRQLEVLEAHGHNIHNQKEMNEIINSIGSNKSTTMLMRALLEPLTRAQLVKEMALRDKVPGDPTGILQKSDPSLKIDAFKTSWTNFETALSTGLTGPAIEVLNKLTAGLTGLGQFLEAHPDIAKVGGDMAIVAGGILGLSAAVKLLGLNVGHARVQTEAATKAGGGAAGGLGAIGGVMSAFALADLAEQHHILDLPKRGGIAAGVEFMDPGLANWLFGKVGASPAAPIETGRGGASPGAGMRTPGDQGLHQDEGFTRQKLGALADKTGIVLTSFDGLDKGTLGLTGQFGDLKGGAGLLGNDFRILEATALGAARALAMIAMGGTGSGGSGVIRASWGSGGGIVGGFGGGPILTGGAGAKGEEADFIRSYAASIGIRPDVALAVARSEGLGVPWGSGVDHGMSFGAFQLFTGGGLGNVYQRVTGRNPRDQHNWKDMDRFALEWAKVHGWGDWHGAARIGVRGRYGIGGGPTVSGPPPSRETSPGVPAARRAVSAALQPIHTHVHIGGREVAAVVTHHMVEAMEHPTAIGGPDTYGSHQGPGTPLNDCA